MICFRGENTRINRRSLLHRALAGLNSARMTEWASASSRSQESNFSEMFLEISPQRCRQESNEATARSRLPPEFSAPGESGAKREVSLRPSAWEDSRAETSAEGRLLGSTSGVVSCHNSSWLMFISVTATVDAYGWKGESTLL